MFEMKETTTTIPTTHVEVMVRHSEVSKHEFSMGFFPFDMGQLEAIPKKLARHGVYASDWPDVDTDKYSTQFYGDEDKGRLVFEIVYGAD